VAELEPLSEQLAVESQRSDELAHDLQVQRAAAFQLDSRCTQLTRDIEHVHAALDEAARSLAASNARAEQLERELSTERASIQQLEARLAEQRDSEAAARREAATSAAHAAHSTKRADALDLRLERDRAKLEEAGQRENALSQQLAQVRSERSDLTKQLAALGASHRAKQLELDRRAVRIDELRAAVKERDARLRELAVQLKASAAEKRRVDGRRGAATASSVGDDLTRIAGIGPALERKLHHLGLKTFRQIARLSRTEIVRIAEQLGTTPERIQRDGWIAAARGALRTKGA
jgi:predicted flap endonuclease-1-like 5' DNA nuclease